MKKLNIALAFLMILIILPYGCRDNEISKDYKIKPEQEIMDKPNDNLKGKLTPEQFHVTQEKGTEAPFSGEYNNHFVNGEYQCVCCGKPLFTSEAKFESSCGWPSFSIPQNDSTVTETSDSTHGMIRTEITCEQCGAHLGHVFNDGPPPSGLRYCINSASLKFVEADSARD